MRGINPKQMKQAMKKMGVKQNDVPATKVVMYLNDKKLVFDNPDVVNVNMMGQDTYQVVGKPSEESLQERSIKIDADDIKTVIDQTGCSEKEAKDAIEAHDYDLAEAVLSLTD